MKKAIFAGSLADGLRIHQVVDNEQAAQDIVTAILANGQIAEAIELQPPSSLAKNGNDCEAGDDFVVFHTGIGNGIQLYGPFEDEDAAFKFGESYRGDDEWEHFVLNPLTPAPAPLNRGERPRS